MTTQYVSCLMKIKFVGSGITNCMLGGSEATQYVGFVWEGGLITQCVHGVGGMSNLIVCTFGGREI